MSTVWYWTRRSLRARARSYAAVAALLALLGGLTLASVAGARRTASAYPRFREAGQALDVHVNAGQFEAEHPEVAGQMPGVVDTATYLSFLGGVVTPEGRPDLSFPSGEIVGSVDGLYFTHDRLALTAGRLPDVSRHHEVAVNEHLVRAAGLRLGDRLDLGLFDPAQEEAVYTDTPPPPVERLQVTIVGIGLFPDEVVQDDTDRIPRMLFTPAFTERNRRWGTYAWTGVKLGGGVADAARFRENYQAALSEGAPANYRERSVVTARTQEAVRPLALALGLFGVVAALAALLLVAQALVRVLRNERHDLATLRAMGAGTRLTSALVLPGAAATIVAGLAGAVGVAAVLSPLSPIGPLRRVEVDPGVSMDWTVVGLGALALGLVLGLVVLLTAFRQAPHRRQELGGAGVPRRSSLVGMVSAAGLPAPAVAGLRLALEPGQGRTAVPVRAALGGAVVAVVALVASLVFGSSLRSLVDEPRLYGWDWDLTVLDESGYGDIDVAKAHAALDLDPAVDDWSGAYFQSITLEGGEVPALGMEPGVTVTPPILSGRPVRGPDEVVLGAKTLDRLGKRLGDTVTVQSRQGDHLLRIVGTAVFPTLGPVLGSYTSLGEGVLLAYDRIPGWDDISSGPKALFVRFRPGADHQAARQRIDEQLPGISRLEGSALPVAVQRPAQIVNYDSMGGTPALLGALLVLAAVLSLGLTLASGVARRRRDLSVLKSLGFTRRQVSATVVWQSSIIVTVGLVVGVPLGVALGRWLWIVFAERLPVVARPTVPVLVLAGLALALLILANLVAAVPARLAGRTPVATILRSE